MLADCVKHKAKEHARLSLTLNPYHSGLRPGPVPARDLAGLTAFSTPRGSPAWRMELVPASKFGARGEYTWRGDRWELERVRRPGIIHRPSAARPLPPILRESEFHSRRRGSEPAVSTAASLPASRAPSPPATAAPDVRAAWCNGDSMAPCARERSLSVPAARPHLSTAVHELSRPATVATGDIASVAGATVLRGGGRSYSVHTPRPQAAPPPVKDTEQFVIRLCPVAIDGQVHWQPSGASPRSARLCASVMVG